MDARVAGLGTDVQFGRSDGSNSLAAATDPGSVTVQPRVGPGPKATPDTHVVDTGLTTGGFVRELASHWAEAPET